MGLRLSKRQPQISIHAPREGSDFFTVEYIESTDISIHAPREGSDGAVLVILLQFSNFNPRSPRGERLCGYCFLNQIDDFNPRSPRGERPVTLFAVAIKAFNFNPRSPRGERHHP